MDGKRRVTQDNGDLKGSRMTDFQEKKKIRTDK